MIEIQNLTKRYGETLAVDDISFTVNPGVATGFRTLRGWRSMRPHLGQIRASWTC